MAFLVDIAFALGALLAAAYCMLLSRRLRALTRLDGDVGSAIAILSQQVDALTQALDTASQSSTRAESNLNLTIARAQTATRNLELLLAAAKPRPPGARNMADADISAKDETSSEGDITFTPLAHGRGNKPRILRQRETAGQRK
ncbi:hypothetical protein [Roseinatronobacter alkalisoli]|uniref:DUF948 domain-containing protein n=1 Tax=Roseinatronobacter alkalisoli TaxID=3028235 RepID=A0ABT5T6K4_9RHOB|nr:hypothetical protein [Roseinatronobacter sp. HJB301]MDD7970754.1 hypothetical protein [Roseinatronobacter sp. HJB301]